MKDFSGLLSPIALAGILGILLSITASYVLAEYESVQLGNVKVIIPQPRGFARATQRDIDEHSSAKMPTELLIMYRLKKNMQYGGAIDRTLDIQIPKSLKYANMSYKEFESVKSILKNSKEEYWKDRANRAEEHARNFVEKNSKEFSEDPEIEIGEIRNYGAFDEGEYHFGYTFLMGVEAQSGYKDHVSTLVISQVVYLIKGKLISMNATSQYKSHQDLEWTHRALMNWKSQVENENK